MIERAAVKEGYKKKALEGIFDIGSGDGGAWRAWRTGSRVPSAPDRRDVLKEARRRGWVETTEREWQKLASLPEAAPAAGFVPPPPPDAMGQPFSAALAAGQLIDDAIHHRCPSYTRINRLERLDREAEWDAAPPAVPSLEKLVKHLTKRAARVGRIEKAWSDAVEETAKLCDKHHDQRELVRAMLIASYLQNVPGAR